MILTGKAKEDFELYLSQEYGNFETTTFQECASAPQYTIFLDEINLPKSIENALIIEFFDSVCIIITISEDSFNYVDEEETKDFWYSVFSYFIKKYSDIEDGLNDYEEYYDTEEFITRQEAINKAIIKANKIYNEMKA